MPENVKLPELIEHRAKLLAELYEVQIKIRELCAMPSIERISRREERVLHLIQAGLPNGEIARLLKISPRTVSFHVTNLFRKYNCKHRSEL